MSLDKESIDKEISKLGVEALIFWELPKVESALNDLCQQWSFNDCGALSKGTVNLSKTTPTPVTKTIHEPLTAIVDFIKKKINASKIVGILEIEKKDAGSGSRNSSFRIFCKIQLQSRRTIKNKTMCYKSTYMNNTKKVSASLANQEIWLSQMKKEIKPL